MVNQPPQKSLLNSWKFYVLILAMILIKVFINSSFSSLGGSNMSKFGRSHRSSSVNTGNLPPDFTVKTTKGDTMTLSKLKGKVVLIDFWATWCGPCRGEIPHVKQIWNAHKNESFTIIGISADQDPETLNTFLQQENITWPQYYEADGTINVSEMYNVHAIPYTVLVDKKGHIAEVNLRGEELADRVTQLLAEN